MKKIQLLFVLLFLPFLSTAKPDCAGVTKKLGLQATIQRLAQDPIALLKGRDTTISEGLLVRRWNDRLKTTFYHTASEPDRLGDMPLVDPDAKAVALFFHGSGTAKSSGRNFIHNMNWLAQQGISGVAVDLPFHASNKGEARLHKKDEFMKWLREVVAEVKKSGKPVYLVGHSFGPEIALQFASEFPKDLKGGGLFLISGAWGKSPSHEWMYENVTTPGMDSIGGDTKVEDNPAGGDWAGRFAEQSDWHARGIPEDVRVKLVVGEKDEWWPPHGEEGKKLPRGVKRVEPEGPYPNQLGNEGLVKKLKVEPPHTFSESLKWTQEKIPQIEIDVVEGYGHFIFESRDKRGGPLLNRLLMDFAGVDYSKTAEQSKKTSRLEARVLLENNQVFKNWVGEKNVPKILSDEITAERVLAQWKSLEFLVWKEALSKLKETDPEYYEQRKYWLAKELQAMPADAVDFSRRGWNANELLADLKRFKEAKESGESPPLSADPYRPILPVLSSTLLGEKAQTTPYGGSLLASEFSKGLGEKGVLRSAESISPTLKKMTYDYAGKEGKVWYALDVESPAEVEGFLKRAYEKAFEENGNLAPKDNWSTTLDGIKVNGTIRLDHKAKTYRLEKVTFEPEVKDSK